LVSSLVILGFAATEKTQKKNFEFSETLLLKIFCNLVPIVKPTYYYVCIAGSINKNRVNKEFYAFLVNIHENIKVNKTNVPENEQILQQDFLGQFSFQTPTFNFYKILIVLQKKFQL